MIKLRSDIQIQQQQAVSQYLDEAGLTPSDKKEFVQNAAYEAKVKPQAAGLSLFADVVAKANFVRIFELLTPKLELFAGAKVLEMGACHGWASVMVKVKQPDCYVVASDLVAEMVQHAAQWETLLGAQLDEKWAFNCRDMPFADEQFDRIFTFASFHHFGDAGDYQPVLREMTRVLKKGGKIVLLYEPSSPKYLYQWAYQRVNSNRGDLGEDVDEDVLVPSRLKRTVQALGCTLETQLFPYHLYRDGFMAGNYYYLLAKLGPLQKLFVSTVNLTIAK